MEENKDMSSDFMFPGNIMFSIMPIFFFIVFAIVIIGIVGSMIKGAKQYSYNNKQPRLSVQASVVDKRTNVSRRHHNHDNTHHTSTSTTYYVTFEFESGDRTEFEVDGREYGIIVSGDKGTLTFQGTRYLGFERKFV